MSTPTSFAQAAASAPVPVARKASRLAGIRGRAPKTSTPRPTSAGEVDTKVVLIAVAAALAVATAWFLLLWSPQGGRLDAASARQVAAQSQQGTLRSQIIRLKAEQGKTEAKQAQLAGLSSAVPDLPELSTLLGALYEAATASGIVEVSVVPSPIQARAARAGTAAGGAAALKAPAGPTPIALTIDVTGTYPQLLAFIDRLGGLSRVVLVDGFSVSADEHGALTAQIDARAFTLTAPPQPSGAKGAPAQGTGTAAQGAGPPASPAAAASAGSAGSAGQAPPGGTSQTHVHETTGGAP